MDFQLVYASTKDKMLVLSLFTLTWSTSSRTSLTGVTTLCSGCLAGRPKKNNNQVNIHLLNYLKL